MPTGIITYAAKITDESKHDIVRNAANWKLNVDYLDGEMEEAEEFGTEVYAILSINWDYQHATFTTMWVEDFNETWQFVGNEIHGGNFRSVELIKS
jgi:hypothetical protein